MSESLAENRATINERRPVKDFQTISRWMHGLNSTYHALQLSLDKRYSHGVTVSTTYTWSKNLDYDSTQRIRRQPRHQQSVQFLLLARQLRPDADAPVCQFVRVGPAQAAKGSKAANAILGNWRFSAISTLQSGRPFSVGASNNPMAGAGTARADLVGTGYPVLDPGRPKGEKLEAYFDKTRFANPAPNTFGTLGRNILFGPGFFNVDMSLAKGWRLSFLGEAGRFEYRFEAFNLFNATHLANPVTGLTNPNFGKITSTDGDPRILQMALKVAW